MNRTAIFFVVVCYTTREVHGNDMCIMQAGINSLYQTLYFANSYYEKSNAKNDKAELYKSYDVTDSSFYGYNSGDDSIQLQLAVSADVVAYLAQKMLSICKYDTRCKTTSLDTVVKLLQSNLVKSTGKAVTGKVNLEPLGYVGNKLSWLQGYVSGLTYWAPILNNVSYTQYIVQSKITEVIPGSMKNVESFFLLGVFYGSSNCSSKYFKSIDNYQEVPTTDLPCNDSFEIARTNIQICKNALEFSYKVYTNLDVRDFFVGLYPRIMRACNIVSDEYCDISPLNLDDFNDIMQNGSQVGEPYYDIVHFGIYSACNIVNETYKAYERLYTCCNNTYNLGLSKEYRDKNIVTPYYGTCTN